MPQRSATRDTRPCYPYCLSLALLLAAPSVAEADQLWLAGASLAHDESSYLYAGAILPLRGNLGDGIIARAWLSRLAYRYDADATEVKASALSTEGGIGYQTHTDRVNAGLFLTAAYRDTDLSPDQPDSEDRGVHWYGRIDAELGIDLAPWRLGAAGNYTPAITGYWSRFTATRVTPWGFRLGPELMVHGNENYHAHQWGITLSDLAVSEGTALGLSLGVLENDQEESGWYAAVGISHLLR